MVPDIIQDIKDVYHVSEKNIKIVHMALVERK